MARQFNGSASNYLSSTLELNLPSDWTIIFRVKNVVSTGDHQIFLGRRGGDTNGWAAGRQASGEFTFWGFGGATGSAGTVALGSSGFDAYAITRAAAGTGTFYKNSTTALGTASITPGSSSGTGLNLGNMNNAGAASFPANCELAEVAIFSRVLTSTELGQWFSGDSPALYDTGLIHYWQLDAVRASEPPSTVGETATVGGANLAEVGTVTSTSHPTMDYGSAGTDATAPGGTGTSTGSGSGGTATGGSAGTGSFTFPAGENNTHSGLMSGVSVNWAWHSGGAVGAASVITNGSGTMTTGGMTISGLPTGAGYGVLRSSDGTVVGYREGTVS